MHVISCANPKGGVGKTTIATILGTCLSQDLGLNVTVIDVDPSQNLTRWVALREREGRPQIFNLLSGLNSEELIDEIDALDDAGKTDFVIIDLEGTANELVATAFSRTHLAIIPMSSSSMDAVQASKASALARRMEKQYRNKIPYVFAFSRTNAAIQTREHKNIVAQLNAANEPVLDVELHDRGAYRAIFTLGKTVSELDETEASSIPKAQRNARLFTQSVLNYLSAQEA